MSATSSDMVEAFLVMQQAIEGVMGAGQTREDRIARARMVKTLLLDGLRGR